MYPGEMLKRLFTSKARVKLLTIFLLNPDGEFFIRELTRKLDEQINSIRRELDNLKKIGLLRSRLKNRKKFFVVNKNFILFNELKNIIAKSESTSSRDEVIKKISKLGKLDLLLLSGSFISKTADVDLLIVGEVDRAKLQDFLDTFEMKKPIRFSVLSREDFLYRLSCNDRFIKNLISDPESIIGVNKLEKYIER